MPMLDAASVIKHLSISFLVILPASHLARSFDADLE
jgi:hypothetical protein